MIQGSTQESVLSTWDVERVLSRAIKIANASVRFGPQGVPEEDKRRLMRLNAAHSHVHKLTFGADNSIKPSLCRSNVEDSARGRLSETETALILSLRPNTVCEALIYIPSLYDFDTRRSMEKDGKSDPMIPCRGLDYIISLAWP